MSPRARQLGQYAPYGAGSGRGNVDSQARQYASELVVCGDSNTWDAPTETRVKNVWFDVRSLWIGTGIHKLAVAGGRHYAVRMCRNIRPLHNFEPPATDDEVRAAALQYVRKISGSSRPSAANAAAFERAVDAVAAASAQLLEELVTSAPPKDREIEAAKARARAAARYAA